MAKIVKVPCPKCYHENHPMDDICGKCKLNLILLAQSVNVKGYFEKWSATKEK